MSDPIVDALDALLTGDPQFTVAMTALQLGVNNTAPVPKLMRSNRQFSTLGQEHYPCWVIDAGDGRGEDDGNEGGGAAGLHVGSCGQDWAFDYDLTCVWVNQDHAGALAQRRGIFVALVRLLLRNPGLNEAATLAYVVQAANDSNQRHPQHFSHFVLRVHHTITRG